MMKGSFYWSSSLVGMFFSSALLVGCAGTMVAYEGPALPKDKVAVITTPPAVKLLAQNATPGIHCINGKRALGSEIQVLPGKQEIVGFFLSTPAYGVPIGMKQFVGSLNFEAQVGHEYHINGGIINSQPMMWIQDATSEHTIIQAAATDHSYKAYKCKDEP